MEVILLRDIEHAGGRGDVIAVKPGYARNFLIPQGMALPATPGNRKRFEQMRAKIDAQHAHERAEAQAFADQIAALEITVAKRVGESETLYGSVTASEVADHMEAKGVTVDRRKLDLVGGIKTLGEHKVKLKLHTEVEAEVTVNVVAAE